MPFTLVAFYETQGEGTLVAVAGLADPHVRVVGDDIFVPDELPFLAAYYVLGATEVSAARIESPTLRRLANIDVVPFDIGTEPGSPPAFTAHPASPKVLEGSEALNLKTTGTSDHLDFGLIWLSNGPIPAVTGEIITVKCTSATTLTGYAWTNAALTFSTTLPSGRYQIVGMRAKSAGLVAARLVIPGHAWRPGCIGCDAYNDIENGLFRRGALGVWGEFAHDVPPTVDFLSVSADTAEEVWLDLIKIA